MQHKNGTDKLTATKNYAMFSFDKENRPLSLGRRKKLRKSLQLHGFISAYPIHCVRRNGRLFVRDGQHRLAISQELGIAVYYVVCEDEANIAEINDTQERWKVNEYAGSWADRGKADYVALREFASRHDLSVSTCISILGDQAQERNLLDRFKAGEFTIRSVEKAERIARLYTAIGAYNKTVRTKFFANALFAVCLVPEMDDQRLIHGAKRAPELLMKYGTRDGYLDMLEQLYNFGRRTKFPLKIFAVNALRERNPANRGNGTPVPA